MKWKQFFTPAGSLDFEETQTYINRHSGTDITILDVRQPTEYRDNHLPGSVLIPLPQLSDRISELDPLKPTLVYCAIGGRSRVAAQMLSGNGFEKVFNVAGGIKAWQGKTAIGPQDSGLSLFSGKEEPVEVLKVAYSLEQGLRDFYLLMEQKAENKKVKDLFGKLSEIELAHQNSIYIAFSEASAEKIHRDDFERMVEIKALEGGLSTQEYLDLFSPDLDSETDVISLAMSIEAQALDLYQRVVEKIKNPESKKIINKIADEEKVHLESLGKLMDSL